MQKRIFTDRETACEPGSEIPRLAEAAIPVRVDDSSGEMHHKFAVFYAALVITGSSNWSDAADRRNWENVVLLRVPTVVKKYVQQFAGVMWPQASPFSGCP